MSFTVILKEYFQISRKCKDMSIHEIHLPLQFLLTSEKKWRSWLKKKKKLTNSNSRLAPKLIQFLQSTMTKMVQSYGGVAFPVCCVFLGPWNEAILNVSINETVFSGHFCLIYH